MIQLPSKENCCGCLACGDSCPNGAINAVKDENGFVYPEVNTQLCVNCGVCMNQCSFIKSKGIEKKVESVWAYRISDKRALNDSTSGGAFTALSDFVLGNGGVVCACVMNERFEIAHVVTEDKITRDSMRRSKYVQSNTEGIFARVKDVLKQGRIVLFVGTPCQTSQMVTYAGEYRDNLIACDFLCHGVPNNDFFKAHIDYLEKSYGQKAVGYYFRGKKYGWNHMLEEVVFANGRICGDKSVQAYSRFFYSGVSLRASCHNCRYRSIWRASDITIADFWGIDKILGKTDNRGYSMVAVNTEKGRMLVEAIKRTGCIIAVETDSVLERIGEPISTCKINITEFWELYKNCGYGGVVNKYTDSSRKASVVHKVKKIIKRILK